VAGILEKDLDSPSSTAWGEEGSIGSPSRLKKRKQMAGMLGTKKDAIFIALIIRTQPRDEVIYPPGRKRGENKTKGNAKMSVLLKAGPETKLNDTYVLMAFDRKGENQRGRRRWTVSS